MITDQQFRAAARVLKCDVPALLAVYSVETAGQGCLADGRVKILFEGHRFWKRLEKAKMEPASIIRRYPKYANVLYKSWNKSKYVGGDGEWARMGMAIELCKIIQVDVHIALDCASYGSFQILGENYKSAGYDSSQQMLTSFNTGGEGEQLNAFVRFIQATGLADELRAHNWAGFAAGFNGTRYRENQYDLKLFEAYNYYSKKYRA